jgi:hypothetical protein
MRRRNSLRACHTAYDLCDHHKQTFRSIFQSDKLIGVKILYFLDRVFQEFATDLSRFTGQTDPLRAASASLRGRQRNTVIRTLAPLRYGIQPAITLLPGLVPEQGSGAGQSREPNHESNAGSGNGRGRTSTSGSNGTHTSSIPNGWKISDGKIFGDFFNPRGKRTSGNISGWPKTPHESSGSPQQLCVRLVTTGKCIKTMQLFSHQAREPELPGSRRNHDTTCRDLSARLTRIGEACRGEG